MNFKTGQWKSTRGTKGKKNERSLKDLWDTIKWMNKLITRVPEEEKKA